MNQIDRSYQRLARYNRPDETIPEPIDPVGPGRLATWWQRVCDAVAPYRALVVATVVAMGAVAGVGALAMSAQSGPPTAVVTPPPGDSPMNPELPDAGATSPRPSVSVSPKPTTSGRGPGTPEKAKEARPDSGPSEKTPNTREGRVNDDKPPTAATSPAVDEPPAAGDTPAGDAPAGDDTGTELGIIECTLDGHTYRPGDPGFGECVNNPDALRKGRGVMPPQRNNGGD